MTPSPNATDRARHYRGYLVALLAVIFGFNCVDRVALGLVLQNIKATFGVSDTELGVLSGIAFAIFYSLLGVPIGRWADRGNRVTIIALTTAIWSVMVVLTGVVQSFAQLLLMRIGVAVGEAGCIPPAYSLISDNFSRSERPRAIANYLLGGTLSVVVGYFLAGWINQLYGWRIMFGILGIPGLALAPLAWFTLREERRSRSAVRQKPREQSNAKSGLRDDRMAVVAKVLWRNGTFRHVLIALCISYFFGYGSSQWLPSFFIRSFHFTTGQLGIWLSIIYGGAGVIGTYCGGRLASRYAPEDERLQLRVQAMLWILFAALSASAYLSRSPSASLALIATATLGISLGSGPLFATAQSVVPERMRAVSVSILFLLANLIGMGLGPLAVGGLSDVFRPVLGQESLRYALLAMCLGYLLGAWELWQAGRAVVGDMEIALREVAKEEAEYAVSASMLEQPPQARRRGAEYAGR